MATGKRRTTTARSRGTHGRRNRLLALAALVLVAAFFAFRQPLVERSRAGTSYAARIGCSCHFVAGRPLEQCRAGFEPGLEWVMLGVDEEARSVTARIPLLAKQTASWREGWGCVLETWQD